MEKKEREDIPNKVDLQKLPVNIKTPDANPEFIDDHVPGNHGAMQEHRADHAPDKETPAAENFLKPDL
ncbi:hypothetical protein [Parasegetibacter sp. NRK P23]|uniref:hypothetical protein n=1 Tax=Parasegetibacter sp. NRK P23 TaxID=2942999 RepID=UPI0020449996|nr:hypothetical protein [Parasegetibacter sp. NRK P23]MCM5529330.1 hypothetical protein [Parasegetibacter sp. NRK P23]